MEKVFFDLIETHDLLGVEVGYNSIAGWGLHVYDRQIKGFKDESTIIKLEEHDRDLLFSKAHVELCKYLSEKNN